jgi:hypothetical protein
MYTEIENDLKGIEEAFFLFNDDVEKRKQFIRRILDLAFTRGALSGATQMRDVWADQDKHRPMDVFGWLK